MKSDAKIKNLEDSRQLSLRTKGYIAYGALTVFVILLSVFIFRQKSVLLEQYDDLQRSYYIEGELHKVVEKVKSAIELHGVLVNKGESTGSVKERLKAFSYLQDVYSDSVVPYFKSDPKIKKLGESLGNASEDPGVKNLGVVRSDFIDLEKMLEQRRQNKIEYRSTLVEGFKSRSNTVALTSVLLGLAGLTLFGTISGIFFTRLARDILVLKERAEKVVKGNRDNMIPITRNDEVGQLASAVNHMMEELREHEHSLEIERHKYFHQEKMAAIGTLSAGIAHEVGNTISAITALTKEVLHVKDSGECPFARRDDVCKLNIILNHIERLRGIACEISGIAQPQSHECDLLDLNALVRSTCSLMHYDMRWKEITLELNLDQNLPAITGCGDQLVQVIMNLLVNAADALEYIDTRTPIIKVTSTIENNEVCLSVEDNGPGMEQHVLENAKKEFFTTKQAGKGTGLGLSLCLSIISAHQGRLEIDSVPYVGTRVRVILPANTGAAMEMTN